MLEPLPFLQTSSNMASSVSMLFFAHSVMRWVVLLLVGVAGLIALRGWLMQLPIIVWQRSVTIIALAACHLQVVLGLVLYGIRFKRYTAPGFNPREIVFWRYEHITVMILAVVLVTLGRVLSKRATTEPAKWKMIAIFYLVAFALMCWAIPWPHTEFGMKRGWL